MLKNKLIDTRDFTSSDETLAASDKVARATATTNRAVQTETAGDEMLNTALRKKAEGDALAKAEAEAISLFQNPPRDLDEAAVLFAQKGTFTADLPPALKNLQQTFNHPALKIVVPFFKTPTNIAKAIIERSPLEFVSPSLRAALRRRCPSTTRPSDLATIGMRKPNSRMAPTMRST